MRMPRKILFLSIGLILAACLPSKDRQISADTARIVKGEIGGQAYYVPDVYFVPNSSRMSDPKWFSIYIQTLYPNFSPLLEPTADLWKRGESYKYIHILANYYETPSNAELLGKETINRLKAFDVVGNEYGLVHQKQEAYSNQDDWDIWVKKNDNGEYESFITCSEKIIDSDNPHCSDNVYWQKNFYLKINFDRRFLPEWQKIQKNSFALLESFKSEQTSRDYLKQRLLEIQMNGEGTQK